MSARGSLFLLISPDGTRCGQLAGALRLGVVARAKDREVADSQRLSVVLGRNLALDTFGSKRRSNFQQIHLKGGISATLTSGTDPGHACIAAGLIAGQSVIVERTWGANDNVPPATSSDDRQDAAVRAELFSWTQFQVPLIIVLDIIRERRPDWTNWSRAISKAAKRQEMVRVVKVAFAEDARQAAEHIFDRARSISSWVASRADRREQKTFWHLEGDAPTAAPRVFRSLSPAKPSVVYDTYWRFAAERQAIFFRRAEGHEPPWTDDEILQQYKFTNAYRASDRVSQYLIRNVIYEGDQSPEEVFFRIVLFKLFNKIETWELLYGELGPLRYSEYAFERYDRVLTKAIEGKRTIYSAAYIMPSGNRAYGTARKHRAHLMLLEQMMEDSVPRRLADASSMRVAFDLLLSYPMIGDFLAYQYVTDLNYSILTNFSEMEFVVPGPGAIDGIHKCFESLGGLSETDIIKVVTDRQEAEFDRLGLNFQSLWGRRLQLIDCQNLFCEISKYARVRHPEVAGVAKRTRIKQKYRPNCQPIAFWFPPKWGINHVIAEWDSQRSNGGGCNQSRQ